MKTETTEWVEASTQNVCSHMGEKIASVNSARMLKANYFMEEITWDYELIRTFLRLMLTEIF